MAARFSTTGAQPGQPIAVATDALCANHVAPPQHDEDPERFTAAQSGLARAPHAHEARHLPQRIATLEELARAHAPQLIEQVMATRGGSGWLDPDTYYSPESAQVALRATGAALALTEALLDGTSRQGVGLWRPPGHHSTADRALGFCLFNHVAVAARHAQRHGVQRILIVDWDVHHGNGTQDIFESDPGVLYISVHQGRPQYPESGAPDDVGRGAGRGYTVNLPLSVGADGATYAAAFERVILPIAEQYRPELTLISAGYDAHELDPLGGMCLRAQDYAWLTQQLVQRLGGAERARVGLYMEGGYHRRAIAECVQSTFEALCAREPVAHPHASGLALTARHALELQRIERVQRELWKLA